MQSLFSSRHNRSVFCFSTEAAFENQLVLNIIDKKLLGVKPDGFGLMKSRRTTKESIRLKKYWVEKGGRLEQQLKHHQVFYQKNGAKHRTSGAMPDPTIAKLAEKSYLILAEQKSDNDRHATSPSLCFYELKI